MVRGDSPTIVGNFVGAVFQHDQIGFAVCQYSGQGGLVPTEDATGARAVDAEHVIDNAGRDVFRNDSQNADLARAQRANFDTMPAVRGGRIKEEM